jgi:hypothetical protein
MNEEQLQRKVHSLAGNELDGILDDAAAPANTLAERALL